MELENIVANTVLLKAREGKLTHKGAECKHYVGLAVSHFALSMQKRWGMVVLMTAVGSLRTARLSTAGNPPPQMQQKMSLIMQCDGQREHNENDSSGAELGPEINPMDHFILTAFDRSYAFGKEGSASHIRLLCLQMNALFRNIIHAEAHTEAGNNCSQRG